MRRLVCIFVVRIWQKQFFSWCGSYVLSHSLSTINRKLGWCRRIGGMRKLTCPSLNIYILIAIASDETNILVAFISRFTSHVIYPTHKGGAKSTSAYNVLCLLTFSWHWSRIAMTFNIGVQPLGCSKTSVRYNLIQNIWKTSPVGC